MQARLISMIFFFVGIYLIVSFSHDLWNLVKKGNEIEKANLNLEKLGVENVGLKKILDVVQSPTFVEKEARDKLGLSKQNETILILPNHLGSLESNKQTNKVELNEPNWRRWWKLFF